MQFNLEPLLNNNRLVVHCPDRDVAVAFVRYIKERYPSKYFRGSPGPYEYWDRYETDMCYLPQLKRGNMQYCDIGYYLSGGYDVININDLMNELDTGPLHAGDMSIETLFGMG